MSAEDWAGGTSLPFSMPEDNDIILHISEEEEVTIDADELDILQESLLDFALPFPEKYL